MKKSLVIILGVVFGLIALGVGFLFAFLIVNPSSTKDTELKFTPTPTTVTSAVNNINYSEVINHFEEFCSMINAGKTDLAYYNTDFTYQNNLSLQKFNDTTQELKGCKNFSVKEPLEYKNKNLNNVQQLWILGSINYSDRNPLPVALSYIKRDGIWKFAGTSNTNTLENIK